MSCTSWAVRRSEHAEPARGETASPQGPTERTQELAALVEAFPLPAFIIDGDARVCLANGTATELLLRDPRLRVANGNLRGSSARETARLLARIGELASAPSHGDAEAILLQGLAELPLRLVVSRLPAPGSRSSAELGRARLLVLVVDPARARPIDHALVGKLYELTPTETVLACGLVEGHTLKELAADRGLSLHTVRTHLKRIFDKTGTHRQAELVRALALLACIPVPTVPEGTPRAPRAPKK